MKNDINDYYELKRKEMRELLPECPLNVLEIGCGEGAFRENFLQVKEYWGVEPVKSIAEAAKDNLDRVLVGTYQDVRDSIPDNYFDLIVCNDVIEHMTDHDEFLQSIKKKIINGGCLVASIPNVRYVKNLWEVLFKKDWKYRGSGILDITHLRFFTQKSINRTMTDNGYSIQRIIGLNSYRPGSILERVMYGISVLFLGEDIKYLQFGIRIVNENDGVK